MISAFDPMLLPRFSGQIRLARKLYLAKNSPDTHQIKMVLRGLLLAESGPLFRPIFDDLNVRYTPGSGHWDGKVLKGR